MISVRQKQDCCGCGACAAACAAKAIAMRPDAEGFLYPEVDVARCARCGRCEQVCPMRPRAKTPPPDAQCFAARLIDPQERRKSQSGGAFWALAQDVLADGGAVYGAAYDQEMRVRHLRATDAAAAEPIRGSKYVQSDSGESFRHVRADLRAGRRVFYSGTPCQIEALRRFLGPMAQAEALLTADIVCFGVFSPAVYRAMLDFVGPVRAFIHRDKSFGWRSRTQTYALADGKEISNAHLWTLYSDGLALRPSCPGCPFAGPDRPGDVTLGDFWGIEHVFPDMDDDRGVSAVIAATPRGKAAVTRALARLEARPCALEDILKGQPRLRGARAVSARRARFWRDYQRLSFERLLRRYTPRGGCGFRIRARIRRALRACAAGLKRRLRR